MPLVTGSRLGVYEVVALIGAGGMGEVYRALDTKLGRSVAIKVLPDAVRLDPERTARFEREARMLAALNHPHIAQLYGMEHADAAPAPVQFLIMELVEGETLADLLGRGALPVDQALDIALQMADALEAAHERGVIHRDLKPANVKLTMDRKVKVLDFGLAKAMGREEETPGAANLTHSPTLSVMATQAGVILGTAAYMSPEQAKGLATDHRSDVFSFGVVLYEMLTGRQPFRGETAPDILASVLVRDADLTVLPPSLNPRIADLLRRCLDKIPKRRWQAVGDLRAEIEALRAAPLAQPASQLVATPPARPLWRRALPVAATAMLVALVTSALWLYVRPRPAILPVTRFSIELPESASLTSITRRPMAISPDGTRLVYSSGNRLYLRPLASFDAAPIPGTEAAPFPTNPVFSPDGQSIAFWSPTDRTLKRVFLAGGSAVTLCPADNPGGISWDERGILFSAGPQGIMQVSADGGTPEQIVKLNQGENAQRPQRVGGALIFTLFPRQGPGGGAAAQMISQSLETGERKVLGEARGGNAVYLRTGHLVYASGSTLFAVPFDAGRLEMRGSPKPIVEGVRSGAGTAGAAFFDVSDTGSLVYVPGAAAGIDPVFDLGLTDRKGGVELLKLPPASYEFPRISPNGRQVAVGTSDEREAKVWIYDVGSGMAPRPLTIGGRNRNPLWSGDGLRVAFQSDREGDAGIFWQRADGTGEVERLTKAEPGTAHVPEAWRGDVMLFSEIKANVVTLKMYSLAQKTIQPFGDVRSVANLINATFSPDGQWVAYGSSGAATAGPDYRGTSNAAAGENFVYVLPFPPKGTPYQISTAGENGHHPLWSPNGRELLYVPVAGEFVARSFNTKPSVSFGNIVQVPRSFPTANPITPRTFDMTPDGRVLSVVIPGTARTGPGAERVPIQVVLNWTEELKQRVPVK